MVYSCIFIVLLYFTTYNCDTADFTKNQAEINFYNSGTASFSSLLESQGEDSIPIDTIQCASLILARYYENNKQFDKAFESYLKALNCKASANKAKALNGIKRINSKQNNYFGNILELFFGFSKYFLVFITVLISLYFIRCLFLVCKWIRKNVFHYQSITIDIQPSKSLPGKNENFTHFKIISEILIQKFKKNIELKNSISSKEINSAKPTMRTRAMSSAIVISAEIVNQRYGHLISKILNFLFPSDYTINGEVFVVNDNARFLVISVFGTSINRKKIIKMYERSISSKKLIEDLYKLSYEVLVYINDKHGAKS